MSKEGREGWRDGPLGRLRVVLAGHRSRCPTAVLVRNPARNRVLSLPALQLRNHGETLLNLIVLLRSQGLGDSRRESQILGSWAPVRSLRSLLSLLCPGSSHSARTQRSLLGEMTPLRKRVEAVTGLRATGSEGVCSPSGPGGRPASAPRTAHRCCSGWAGSFRAAGAASGRLGGSPRCAWFPTSSLFFFYLPYVPYPEAGAVAEAEC